MNLLGVNIDHIATIRNARGGNEPSIIQGALLAQQAGADQITVHLREDRRHIKDQDLFLLRQIIHTKLNLEMALSDEIISIAKRVKPDTVTFVPEKRQELTTEGGLFLREDMREIFSDFRSLGIQVSVFIEPNIKMIELAKDLLVDAVEIHTGTYANAQGEKDIALELKKIETACQKIKNLNMRVVAGHGLNYHNIVPLTQIESINEFNIGHSIVSRAVFTGLEEAVGKMKTLINLEV